MNIRQFIASSVLIILSFVSTNVLANQPSTAFTPKQVQALHEIIYNYIVDNPGVLVKASEKLRQQTEHKQESTTMTAIKNNKAALFDDKASPATHNPHATVYIVEFFDYQCSHCKAMEPVIENLLEKNNNLKVIYKELPIFGGISQYAAQAALAANEQGKYVVFHQALMNTPAPLTEGKVIAIAKKLGLNVDKLKQDMTKANITQAIKSNFALAQKLQLLGTPALVLSNKAQTQFRFIPGAIDATGLNKAIASVNTNS